MRRSTLVFLLFVIVIGGIIGLNSFLQNQEPIQITIAVDPLVDAWARDVAQAFNEENILVNTGTQPVEIQITTIADARVWTGSSDWSLDSHPDGWLMTTVSVLDYIPTNLTFDIVQPSTANTPLVWGGFGSRVDAMTEAVDLSFDWGAVQNASDEVRWGNIGGESSWGNVNMAINWSSNSTAGLAVLLSATGHYHNTTDITSTEVTDDAFDEWVTPLADAMRNSRRIGENPAQTMASRGASSADFGLLPEVQWLANLDDLNEQEVFVFDYPTFNIMLEFPLAVWDSPNTDPVVQEAVRAFGDFLVSDTAQNLAMGAGLRPANGDALTDDTRFLAGEANGILIDLPSYEAVIFPSFSVVDRLLRILD